MRCCYVYSERFHFTCAADCIGFARIKDEDRGLVLGRGKPAF